MSRGMAPRSPPQGDSPVTRVRKRHWDVTSFLPGHLAIAAGPGGFSYGGMRKHLSKAACEFVSHCRESSSFALAFIRRYWIAYMGLATGIGLVAVIGMQVDRSLLPLFQFDPESPMHTWAGVLSTVGRFDKAILYWAIGAWTLGILCRRTDWKRLGTAILLAALMAGLTANLFRGGLGRGRPCAATPAVFTGPTISHDYNGFPSGHATAAFAAATVIAMVHPATGVPAYTFATAVGWSRMQRNRHYPTDIFAGASLGILVALGYGQWASQGSLATQPSSTRRKRAKFIPRIRSAFSASDSIEA